MTESEIKQEAERLFPAGDYRITLPDVIDFAKHCVDKATGWRPIQTAPKDRRVLVLAPSKTVYAAHWVKHPSTGHEAWCISTAPDGTQHLLSDPTHWADCPAPEAA